MKMKVFLAALLFAGTAYAQTAGAPFYSFRYTADGFYAPDGGMLRTDRVYDASASWLAGRTQNGVWAINTSDGRFFQDVVFAPEFNRGRCAVPGIPISDRHQGVSVAIAADRWILADNYVRTAASRGCEVVVLYRLVSEGGNFQFAGSFEPVATWVARSRTVVRNGTAWLPLDVGATQCMVYRLSDMRWFGNETCPGQTPTSTAWRVDAVAVPSPYNPAPDFDYYLSTTGAPTPTPAPTQPPEPTAPPTTATPAPSPTPCTGGIIPGPFGWCYDCAGNRVPGYIVVGGVCVPEGSPTATRTPTSVPTAPPASPTASPTSTSTPVPSPTIPPTASPVPTCVPPTPTPDPCVESTPPRAPVEPVGDRPERPNLLEAAAALAAAIAAFIAGRKSAVK